MSAGGFGRGFAETAQGPGSQRVLPCVCPQCKGPLGTGTDGYTCGPCQLDYPVLMGIPDFRVYPDPYIDYGDDHRKAARLAAEAEGISFAELVERYWELTPDVPRALVGRYVRHALGAVERAHVSLATILGATQGWKSRRSDRDLFLEVGCGTGGFLVAAARHYRHVVGIDIAFRWLILARKRIGEAVQSGELTAEQAASVQLMCCCAEYLPFVDQTFDLVVASDVIEHTAFQEDFLRQCRRALAPGGVLFVATPNRFSLAPEPHVRVWGVGFLPRRVMGRYVRLVRGIAYDNIHLLSCFDLARLFQRAGFARWKIILPQLSDVELRRYPRWERWGFAAFHRLSKVPGFRQLLYLCGPFFHAVALAPAVNEGQALRGSAHDGPLAARP